MRFSIRPSWAVVVSASDLVSLSFVAIYAWLMSSLPLVAIPQAGYDDGLFVRGAQYLMTGRWLGPYDNLTLAKGPFYPLWIAATSFAGLPLLTAQALLYGFSCLLLARALRPWLRSESVCLVLFLIILFNPASFGVGQLRVMREGLYVPLTILLFALLAWWFHWRSRSLAWRSALAAGFGAILGCYWCTREEGLWIVPSVAAAFAMLLFYDIAGAAAPRRAGLSAVRLLWRREMALIGLALLSTFLVVGGFRWMNFRHYGVFDVVEFNQPEFVAAYGALGRIGHDQAWQPYVVIPRRALELAYQASPAAAELRPYFDGAGPAGFAQVGCATYNVIPCDGEIRAGWFMWALRDAVAQAGHYRSAGEARSFYARLTREIGNACDEGRLTCLPPRATMAPPFRPEYLPATLQTMTKILHFAAALESVSVPTAPQSCMIDDCGQSPGWPGFLDTVHAPLFVPAPWLSSAEALPRRSSAENAVPSQGRANLVARGLEKIVTAYRRVLPWFLTVAAFCYLGAGLLALRHRRIEPLLLCASLAGLLALCRITLLAYLDATAIPSVNSLYLSPAYPALLVFGATSILLGIETAAAVASHRLGGSDRRRSAGNWPTPAPEEQAK